MGNRDATLDSTGFCRRNKRLTWIAVERLPSLRLSSRAKASASVRLLSRAIVSQISVCHPERRRLGVEPPESKGPYGHPRPWSCHPERCRQPFYDCHPERANRGSPTSAVFALVGVKFSPSRGTCCFFVALRRCLRADSAGRATRDASSLRSLIQQNRASAANHQPEGRHNSSPARQCWVGGAHAPEPLQGRHILITATMRSNSSRDEYSITILPLPLR